MSTPRAAVRIIRDAAVILAATLVGCASTKFSSGAAGAGGTSGAGASGPDASGSDAASDQGAAGMGGGVTPGDASADTAPDAPCDVPGPDADAVYVDKQFQGPDRTGSQSCPLATINEATQLPRSAGVKRTIHVVGATGGVEYAEATRVIVEADVTLKGDGPAMVTIKASGACAGTPCAVHVQPGGTLQGFTVTCPSGTGIVTGAAQSALGAPLVKNVAANSSSANGISTLGQADLGPEFSAEKNGGQGIDAQFGKVRVLQSAANSFSANAANGIDVAKGAVLVFEGGTATGNGFNGIRFDQSEASVTDVQQISNLVATTNNNGIAIYGGSVKIRGSTLLQNKSVGLFFAYGANAQLDIGTPTDPGKNTFGSVTAANNNSQAGVSLCNSPGLGSLQADGNYWAHCAPLLQAMASCGTQPVGFTDLGYALAPAATPGNPLVMTSCTQGQ